MTSVLPQRYTPSISLPASAVQIACAHLSTLGECPLWSVEEQCLYFVDIAAFRVHRFDPLTGALRSFAAPEEPACLALMAGRRLMVGLRSGFAVLNTESGAWGETLKVDYDPTQFRFNDGRTDSAGRFWAGTVFAPRTSNAAALYCLERGEARKVLGPETEQGVKTSNGLAFDAVSGWMYHSDTSNHIVRRYDYDARTGSVGQGMVFAHMQDTRPAPSYGGRPDGAALDIEGYYWSAQYEGGRILRFAPDGSVNLEIQVPAKRPTMLAFGGTDLRTLYITSAREGANEAELAQYPHSGALFSLDLAAVAINATGLPEALYLE
jgi:sugar lactone lactonase YvrE